MKLDVNDPKVFDQWRERYWELADIEHQAFSQALAAKYPDQRHFHSEAIQHALGSAAWVVEVGGWDGALAASCLELGTIERWVNHEVCDVPSVANDTRYHRILHEAFRWFRDRRVFPARTTVVAAHAIEHLHDADFMALIHGFAQADTLIFEAPIGEGPSDWTGYEGTHILRMGWRDIRGALREYGYKPERITDTVWRFHRGTT